MMGEGKRQESKREEVILVVNMPDLGDKEVFEKHLKREGFRPIENEPFSYLGETDTPKVNTVLYIFSAIERAMQKSGTSSGSIIFQIGQYPMEAYRYDKKEIRFVPEDL